MNNTDDYRYPGSQPFQDTLYDRRLFFGRDEEVQDLLDMILAQNLVVLFAKSGVGKTSLLNAGIMEPLRKREFLPLTIRFTPHKQQSLNKSGSASPLQLLYSGIEDIVKKYQVKHEFGATTSLWQYFSTSQFWSSEDVPLEPVLILDQFEEFFLYHAQEERMAFITQLADLASGRIPKELRKLRRAGKLPRQTVPSVKIIVSLREDSLGHLEEVARTIPYILQNRFRLLPLRREQAHEAIEKPAQLHDSQQQFKTPCFRYTSDAIEAMLDFLCSQTGTQERKTSQKVEPFQLQLLCQHIEHYVRQQSSARMQAEVIIQEKDLGGKEGMINVLEGFYDRQVKRAGKQGEQRRIHKLCEKGLISHSNKRLSLEEEEIQRRFHLSPQLLGNLVNSRLLRAEHRVGSVYYELSHDTLVEPIRKSQKKRKTWLTILSAVILVGIFLLAFILLLSTYQKKTFREHIFTLAQNFSVQGNNFWEQEKYPEAIEKYQQAIDNYETAIELNPENPAIQRSTAGAYNALGKTFLAQGELYADQGRFDEAIKNYQQAIDNYESTIELDPENIERQTNAAAAYKELGRALLAQSRYDEAYECYQTALQYHPNDIETYKELGALCWSQGRYDEARKNYQIVLQYDPENADVYKQLGDIFLVQGLADEARQNYQTALKYYPEDADIHHGLGDALSVQENYEEALEHYHIALKYYTITREPATDNSDEILKNITGIYKKLGDLFLTQRLYEKAGENYQMSLNYHAEDADSYKGLGDVLSAQGQYLEAIENYQTAIHHYTITLKFSPGNLDILLNAAGAYQGLGKARLTQGRFDVAREDYQIALLFTNDPDTYRGLGDALLLQGNAQEARQNYQQAIENYNIRIMFNPEDVSAKINLAELSLLMEEFDEVFRLVSDVQNDAELAPAEKLAVKFLVIATLLFQEKSIEALHEVEDFIALCTALPENYEKRWRFPGEKYFIETNKNLGTSDKALLLQLIEILESSPSQINQKLQDLHRLLSEKAKEKK